MAEGGIERINRFIGRIGVAYNERTKQGSGLMTPRKLQSGTRVRAARTIRDGNRQRAIYQNTEGTVLYCSGGTAAVYWDDSSIFLSVPMAALTPLPFRFSTGARPAKSVAILTTAALLRFESIQDLLIALGYEERQKAHAMINPTTTHVIDFEKIASRSVFEFVRWGLAKGWLTKHVKKNSAV